MDSRTRIFTMIGALIISGALIGGAYVFSGPSIFSKWSAANAASTDDLLKAYAAKDSDNDGLPDWEEALYGTDPNNPMSFRAGVKDGDAVAQGLIKPKFSTATATTTAPYIPGATAAPNSLTDSFAKTLLSQYLQSNSGTQPTQDQIAAFVQQSVTQLAQSRQTPDAFTQSDLHIVPGGPDALTAYATRANQAFVDNDLPATESEGMVVYLSNFVDNNSTNDLKKVTAIATSYGNLAKELVKVPVPPEASYAQLAVANELMHMHDVGIDMATVQSDPLRSMVAITQYKTYATGLVNAMSQMYTVFLTEGVTIAPGAPGYRFYNAAKINAAAATPTP